MAELFNKNVIRLWRVRIFRVGFYLFKKWYFILLAIVAGGGYGYYKMSKVVPTYSATFTFVLSTDQTGRSGALAGLAAQLGVDGLTTGPDNIFSGDNIIELFKSRKLIGAGLQSEIDRQTHQTLLNYIAQKQFNARYKKLGPFGTNPDTYTQAQTGLYRSVISSVASSFLVFKKDKKLIFYNITATSADAKTAYFVAKEMLDQTSQYFIDTKTRVSATSVRLLKQEADSLATVLSKNYSATASMNDRTYNLNPSVTVQRSGLQFNIAKANALAGAYTEVMRNLEVAKMNLQKETPLYRIIDEPELPLYAAGVNKLRYTVFTAGIAFILVIILLIVLRFHKSILSLLK
ncbi:hypothetical protein BEL04_07160 [Mucilaginibacter sp. PPCGB 2223]|uniref:hypothetical protein n=1 Tax=Mucilaginibacter sp. PPCGB 2223 TaxID=1886027 RepID=UPI000824794A|nr:hypothetical protein [Mucilaginibacter sp. PPCGB 2223]OCX54046.1 hypothetical protein BEL04_07160 [Mucilaginibacter sp. PPCGB 2223]